MNEETKQEDVVNPGNADASMGRTVPLVDIVIVIVVAITMIICTGHYWYNRGYQDGVLKMYETREPCDRAQCTSFIIDTERRCEVWRKR
jgi:hypothetical protein